MDHTPLLESLAPSPPAEPVVLKKLQAWHKQVLSLLAQGEDRRTIAQICECTPEYVTFLAKQDVCQDYLRDIQVFVDQRLLALSEKSVDIIADILKDGGNEEKLKAARLQLESVGRVGKERPGVNINVQAGLIQILSGIPPESQRVREKVVGQGDSSE